MADPPPVDTPAASARTSDVIADALAVSRGGASLADAAADLFSNEYERAEGRLADMLAASSAPAAAPGARVAAGATGVSITDPAFAASGAPGVVDVLATRGIRPNAAAA